MLAVLEDSSSSSKDIVMLDEWDEDNELVPLEPVIERAGSTATTFAHSTFGSCLKENFPERCTKKDEENEPPVPRWRVDEWIQIELYPIV